MDYQDYYFNNRRFQHEILVKTDETMVGFVIDFAKMAIRGAFFLNGAAAIAALGMFNQLLLSFPNLGKDFYLVVLCLGLGAFFASAACCVAYFTQKKYQMANAENLISEITQTDANMLFQKMKDDKGNIDEKSQTTLELQIKEYEQEKENRHKNSVEEEKKGDIFCWFAILCLFASYMCFFTALYNGYRTINQIPIRFNLESKNQMVLNI